MKNQLKNQKKSKKSKKIKKKSIEKSKKIKKNQCKKYKLKNFIFILHSSVFRIIGKVTSFSTSSNQSINQSI